MVRGFLIAFLFFVSFEVSAGTALPHHLNDSDRHTAAQILGLGSAVKVLSNPYPLGGYSGFEVGIGSEYIPFENVASLGSTSADKGEYQYYTLSFGKGLFYNVDLFLQFAPLPQKEGLSNYGAQLRWGFYEAYAFPISFSVIFSGGGTSYSSLINSNTLGIDLVATVSLKDVALYFGLGQTRSVTTFIGGDNGITDDGQNHQADVVSSHLLFGTHLKWESYFLALEVDRYYETTYGGKIGMRF